MKNKIVITDSGLGGLSVLGELEYRLKFNPILEEAELVFFNSLHSSNYGYNSMNSMEEKATVFNNALTSVAQTLNPDLILIACNTLSVVYPFTKFSKSTNIQVKGIVETGVSLFKNELRKKPDSKIILFGTPTTIDSNVYTRQLISAGIKEQNIISQACPELETAIQNNPIGKNTEELITKFVDEGIKKSGQNFQNLFAGLCCTHYGYSQKLFYDKLGKRFNGTIKILNPNNSMLDFLFEENNVKTSSCNVNVKIISQVKIKQNEIDSLAKILEDNAPKTAMALKEYTFVKNLFGKE